MSETATLTDRYLASLPIEERNRLLDEYTDQLEDQIRRVEAMHVDEDRIDLSRIPRHLGLTEEEIERI